MKVLWKDSRLDEVNCVYLPIAKAPLSALGGIEGLYEGCRKTIEFPSVFFPIIDLEEKLKIKATPADVIRHEFGHALAEQYPEVLKKDKLFSKAFGDEYGDIVTHKNSGDT